jgi:hypothetical protein
MYAKGELTPMPQAAIFADTGDEPAAVYKWLEWLEEQLPFPVIRVRATRHGVEQPPLSEMSIIRRTSKNGNVYVTPSLPLFVKNAGGGKGMSQRQCTREYKIDPINRKIRELANVKRGEKEPQALVAIGISTDEALRIKPSRAVFVKHFWPLIDAGMSRQDCKDWMAEHGFPEPPRSACVYCPYHSDKEWIRLKTQDPEGFAKAVQYEKDSQAAYEDCTLLDGVPYLHADRIPLEEVKFDNADPKQADMFNNECEGMCGV